MWAIYIIHSNNKTYTTDPEWDTVYEMWIVNKVSKDWLYVKEFIQQR